MSNDGLGRSGMSQANALWGGQYIDGVSAPFYQLEKFAKEQEAQQLAAQEEATKQQYLQQASEESMEAANKGVVIPSINDDDADTTARDINANQFKKKKASKKGRRKR